MADLRRKKAYEEKRNLPLRTISAETGLAVGTVQRVMNGKLERVYISTLDTLCRYFGVQSLAELVEYVPEATEEPTSPQKPAGA